MPGRGERERALEARERGSRVQPERALCREAEEPQRRRFELARLLALPGGAGELEGSRVVVGEHVGEVLDPVGSLRLDPGGGGDVAGGARGARQLVVGDVAGEDVPERILGLPRHRRLPRRPHQLLARQLPQRRGDTSARSRSPIWATRSGPEHLADHGSVGQQRLRLRLQRVEARGDQRLHRIGERHLRTLPQLPARAGPDEQVAVLAAAGRTPRRRAGCRRPGRGSAAAPRPAAPSRPAAPRRAGRSPPATAAPG